MISSEEDYRFHYQKELYSYRNEVSFIINNASFLEHEMIKTFVSEQRYFPDSSSNKYIMQIIPIGNDISYRIYIEKNKAVAFETLINSFIPRDCIIYMKEFSLSDFSLDLLKDINYLKILPRFNLHNEICSIISLPNVSNIDHIRTMLAISQ